MSVRKMDDLCPRCSTHAVRLDDAAMQRARMLLRLSREQGWSLKDLDIEIQNAELDHPELDGAIRCAVSCLMEKRVKEKAPVLMPVRVDGVVYEET